MKLTEFQESMIAHYLREVARLTPPELAPEVRERGLAVLEARIRKALEAHRRPQVEDAQVEAAVAALGSPLVQAAALEVAEEAAREQARRGPVAPVWLGVCAWASKQFDVTPRVARVVAFGAGLLTGPLAVIAYVVGYALLRKGQPKEDRDPIDWVTIVWRGALTLVIAYVLARFGSYALLGIRWGYDYALHRDFPALGQWGYITYRASAYHFYAVISATPLAALSGLPLAGGWSKTLYRLSQAFLALYAIALSFGLASFVTGLILDLTREFAGTFEIPFLN